MKERETRIALISDVTVGYGSPQVQMLAKSLADHYDSNAVILEPDQSGKIAPKIDLAAYSVRRIATRGSPYGQVGRREYILKAAKVINEMRPDILVIFCTFCLPVLLKLKYRPKLTIYDSIESIPAYGPYDVELNRHLADQLDIVIFPEENRANLDSGRCGFNRIPMAILYNAANERFFMTEGVPPEKRRKTLLYSGTIQRGRTFAEYFLKEEIRDIPIDLFGNLEGADRHELEAAFLSLGSSNVRYRGYINAASLKKLRKTYAFAITMWAPTDENQLYAAPNKFFEAIADYVPPITPPHPQCKMLINRYKCGIVMIDWSFEAFQQALEQAQAMFGTEMYQQMVENCRKAVLQELNWETQFAKVKRLLPGAL